MSEQKAPSSDRCVYLVFTITTVFSIFAYAMPTPKGKAWLDWIVLAGMALNVLSFVMWYRRRHYG